MRFLVAALAVLFAFSLPLAAQAGDGCPYAEEAATTASTDTINVDAAYAHAEACGACPHAAAMATAEGECPCAGGDGTASRPGDADVALSSEAAADTVATTD